MSETTTPKVTPENAPDGPAAVMDAARRWIGRDWSMIPHALVVRAFKDSPEDLELLAGGAKTCSECDEDHSDEDAPEDDPEGEEGEWWCPMRESWVPYISGPTYDWPGAHGWLFSPDDNMDEKWIRSNLSTVAECGFLVYDSDDTGIMLAIDGGGYSFYYEHWVPLYRARGFTWHKS